MGLEKIGQNLGKEIVGWTRTSGKGLLATQSIKVNTAGLKLQPQLEADTVQFAAKKLAQINAKADELLIDLRRTYYIDSIEKNYPDIVEEVRLGKINSADALCYSTYKSLENFRMESPEVFVLFGKEGALDLWAIMEYYRNVPIQIAKEMPISQIKEIYAEVDAFANKLDFEPKINHYINALIMKKYNPKTYKYLMSSDDARVIPLFEKWGDNLFGNCPSSTMLKNITLEQIHAMAYNRTPPIKNIGEYVYSSDEFMRCEKAVKELSKDLSKFRLDVDTKVYRGEKTVGMFDSIGVDKNLEKQIRQLLEINKDNAKGVQITEYTGRYGGSPSTNLYDFLYSKKTLTLADAMQMAKYGDENLVNEIILRIKNSKIIDTRFKSYSFDEDLATWWKGIHSGDNTTILQKATINKGTQGCFHDGSNAQFEIILNNTPKEISCNNVVYDKKTDTFVMDTIVQNL